MNNGPFFGIGMPASELEVLRAENRKHRAEQQRINEAPHNLAVLLFVHERRGYIRVINGTTVESPIPDGLVPGDLLRVSGTGQVIGKSPGAFREGTIAKAGRKIGEHQREVTTSDNRTLVYYEKPGLDLNEGDSVFVFADSIIVDRVAGSSDADRYNVEVPTVEWDDVGGQDEAKLALRRETELPLLHPEIFKAYGQTVAKGVLLSGPPGCGKTLLGRALATSLTRNSGGVANFFYVKGPEFISMWAGESERSLRGLFAEARRRAKNGGASIIFFDEAEAVLSVRTSMRMMNVEKTIVPTFLTEVDGLAGNPGVIVVLATNRPDALDPAVVRDDRIDRRVTVRRPNLEEAGALFELHMRGKPSSKPVDDLAAIVRSRLRSTTVFKGEVEGGGRVEVTLEHLASGAMVKGLVKRATKLAIARDIEGDGKPSGVSVDDVVQAIEQASKEVDEVELRIVLEDRARVAARSDRRILIPG